MIQIEDILVLVDEYIKQTKKINMDLVISRYNENLDWINKLPIRDDINIVIYNKGQYIDKDNILLKNVGREAHTYITYILDNFDCLPNYVCFLQGNPFDHCRDIINKIVDFS